MSVTRFWRSRTFKRAKHLSVFILIDEVSAFQAYRLLQTHGISPEHLAIVGRGYCTPEQVGLREPLQIAWRKARWFAVAGGTLGSFLGFSLWVSVQWQILLPRGFEPALAIPAIGILGGFCGAVVGALIGFLGEGSQANVYRYHVRQGRYLLMVEGPQSLVQSAREILQVYAVGKPR
ncbi:hypothetical protein [Geitlerinema sp. PCC 9228]|uniref:hypothetical protein n=1 Tax=Geitlerinema sp. PCC 9228 TaxID=111611 RepID=UPI0008F9CBBF|nr:hypothetical protein [Geitlerinema sp. PCC 9228]